MLENIYVCRHGYRMDWEDPSVDSSPTGDFHDPPLAPAGLVQAAALGEFLSAHAPQPDALFSSPLYRCLQTITPLAARTGLPVHIEHGLGEWFSPVTEGTGLHVRGKAVGELAPLVGKDLHLEESYASTYFPDRRGESMRELRERLGRFLDVWNRRVEAEMPHIRTAVLMTHAAIVIGVGRSLLDQEAHDVGSATASVSLYRRKGLPPLPGYEPAPFAQSDEDQWAAQWKGMAPSADLGEWVQLLNGEAGYLSKGPERAWKISYLQLDPSGELITDPGDGKPWTENDLLPVGLGPGMEKYLNNHRK